MNDPYLRSSCTCAVLFVLAILLTLGAIVFGVMYFYIQAL